MRLTVQQVANEVGVKKIDVVYHWIASGELKATNVATHPGTRPQWRIHPDDLQEFLRARQATPPAPKTRRQKPQQKVTQYF